MTYTPLRYARVGETEVRGNALLPIMWVQIGRFDYEPGTVEYCVDYLDDQAEEAEYDDTFDSLEEAVNHASQKYGLSTRDWQEGRPHLRFEAEAVAAFRRKRMRPVRIGGVADDHRRSR